MVAMKSMDELKELIHEYLQTQSYAVSSKRIAIRTSIKPKVCRYLLRTYFENNLVNSKYYTH